ncbi:MAG: 6-phosphofructokinase [Desulfuromonas sp.]|nr:MAG: 6-phosphofructokinase [Desulfuromonas sp.]
MKRIAVLTSGGDCSGMNPTLRAVVRAALVHGLEVLGIFKGYRGLMERLAKPLSTHAVSGILQRGGTFLQSARCPEMLTSEGLIRAVDGTRALGIDAIIVIGGEGSIRGACALHHQGIPVLAIPASIDNDIPFTDMALGVDTALNNIIHAVDAIKETASSHDRTFVVETMGRNSGYLAVVAAIASGAEFSLIPEAPGDIETICQSLRQRFDQGRDNSIIIVAEGAGNAHDVAAAIKDRIGFEVRIMVLGHYQRGGSPSAFDRLLGSRFGIAAIDGLLNGKAGCMVALNCAEMCFVDLEKVTQAKRRPVDRMLPSLAEVLGL